jgi:hypothetical protein
MDDNRIFLARVAQLVGNARAATMNGAASGKGVRQ